MSSPTDRRLGFPARDELRAASLWVWVLLAIAVVNFVVVLTRAGAGLSGLAFGFTGSMPAVLAAALIFVSPREKLVRVAAFGFATPVAIDAVGTAVRTGLLTTDVTSSDYAQLVPRLMEWTDALSSFAWVFTFLAIACLAVYIGPVLSRAGWLIVGISIAIAAAQMLVSLFQWQSLYDEQFGTPVYPIDVLIPSMLSRLVVVAWGYLLAVTFERRMAVLVTASALALAGSLLTVLSSAATLMAGPSEANAGVAQITPFGWITQLFWIAAVVGVLLELPRHGRQRADDEQSRHSTISHEAFSPGQ